MNEYKITGVQLGMLIALEDKKERKELIEGIIYNSEIENSTKRFVVEGDYIVDTQTKLVWEKDMGKRGQLTWNDAMKIKGNMRVPTRREWRTLSNPREYPTREELKEIGFINVKYWYWTSYKYN